MTTAIKPPEWDVLAGLTVESAGAPLALATLAYLVHLREGSVLLLRDDDSNGAWRHQFNARLRTCGPWDEEQVVDYLSMTYGSDCAKWPFSKATVARVFRDPKPDRWMAIARDTPAVHTYLSLRSHRTCKIPEPCAGPSGTRGEMTMNNTPSLKKRVRRALGLALMGTIAWTTPVAHAATFVVTTTADTAGNTCTTPCSLRQAINAANATSRGDTINFSFSIPAQGQILFQPASPLPNITGALTINGYSQSQTAPNTNANASNAKIRIRLDGINAGANAIGLSICANDVSVKGLDITRWSGAGIGYGYDTDGSPCPAAYTGGSVLGNFIGVSTTANAAAANQAGVRIRDAIVAVGSALPADRNVISANSGSGIEFDGASAAGASVRGNLIGTDLTGTQDFGNSYGATIHASNIVVGDAAAPNRIRYNFKGVRVTTGGTALDNDLQRNHYSDNEQLAIDLGDDGITANDANDADSGPNGFQNVPQISDVARIAGGVHVDGSLDVPFSVFAVTYTIGLYASLTCSPSGSGEGEIFLGTKDVGLRGNTTETFSFDHTTATTIPVGSFLTLTVHGPDGTSEFTGCVAIDDVQFEVNSADDAVDAQGCSVAHCSLREAINAANTHSGPDVIRFAIGVPASGEILIQPNSPLPILAESVTLDGYSQAGSLANTDLAASNAQIRVRVDGANVASGDHLFEICANDTAIRGLSITGMSAGLGSAIAVCATVTGGVVIAGNFIGLASDGSTAAGNDTGVELDGNATVGGAAPADRNVIGKNFRGVRVGAGGSVVLGNLIGTDKAGTLNKGNSIYGIGAASGALDATIGSASAPNLIRFNLTGIDVQGSSTTTRNLAWTYNRIFGNSSLGIDIGGAGPTGNDLDDADSGPNRLQNFPQLSKAERSANGIRVEGSLDVPTGTNNVPYVIGVYANGACDGSGFGEGERLLGAATVNFTQTAAEAFSFELVTDDPLEAGVKISATATGPDGSSEFSACLSASDPPPTLQVNSVLDNDDGTCDLTHCTLREAINRANVQAGENQILFAIPGAGPHAIVLGSALPVITEALVVDGYSQAGSLPNASGFGSDAVIDVVVDAAGQPNVFRVCSTGKVELRGLALGSASASAVATMSNAATCSASGTLVLRGNFFGLDAAGAARPNQSAVLATHTVSTIGSGALADRNLFANSAAFAVRITGNGSNGSTVANNIFGTGVDGITPAGNLGTALELVDVSNVTVSAAALEANRFRFNQRGIVIKGASSTGNRVFANEFADNVGMAIDLSASGSDTDGVTANDADDVDVGPNALQNFPVLTTSSATASSLTINGTLDVFSAFTEARTIALYESASCDSGNNREGEILLDSRLVNFSNAAQDFSITLDIPPPAGPSFITATATDFQGNTSELSNCLGAAQVLELFADGFE